MFVSDMCGAAETARQRGMRDMRGMVRGMRDMRGMVRGIVMCSVLLNLVPRACDPWEGNEGSAWDNPFQGGI